MKLNPITVALWGCLTVACSEAQSVADSNLFVGKPAVASSLFGDGSAFPVAQAVDGTGNDLVFANGDTQQRLVIHGFNSKLRVIRLWTASDLPPTQVTIRSSTSDTNSLDGAHYETLLVATVDLPNAYPATWLWASDGYHRDFVVQAPEGTRSVWFDFGRGNGLNPAEVGWARIKEVQGFSALFSPFVSDNNLFRGTEAVASSEFQHSPDYPVAHAIDGAGSDFVFYNGDAQQRLVIHGFNSGLRLIRLWTNLDLNPTAVTIRSSTSDTNSLDGADFETLLVPTISNLHTKQAWRETTEGHYWDFLVQAPEGTRSVWFDFGSGNGLSPTEVGWARIKEVQGFSALFTPVVTEGNLFPGKQAVSSSVWSDGTEFPVAHAIDGTGSDFVFAGGDTQQRLVIRGLNSGLRLIRLWTNLDLNPTAVAIRSSTNDTPSLAEADYETPLVPAVAVTNTLPPWTVASVGYYMNFFVQAPEGTRSVWFDFGSGNGLGPTEVGWARIREVQGFSAAPSVADANLLSGKPVAASSELGNHPMVAANDGESGGAYKDLVFDAGDASQRLVVHGFYGGVRLVRLWAGDLRPRRITLKSSKTDQTSLNAADYETTLITGPVSLDGRWMASDDGAPYVEIAVNAPMGTRSLFADFGSGNDTSPDAGFARITEIQAFKAPGPSATVLTLR